MKILFFHILFLGSCLNGMAQRWEVGAMAGASNYIGDLAPGVVFSESHPAGGVLGRINVSNYFALKAGIMVGKISGSDLNFSHNQIRNLSFQTNVSEFSFQFEFNFFRYGMGPLCKRFSPYILSGVSLFHFDPKALYKNNLIALQPLGTEGQFIHGRQDGYSRVKVAVPIGGGIKYDISNNFIIGLEAGFRTTFTDYLDDVSGNYPSLEELDFAGQRMSALMADRSRELTLFDTPLANVGDQRGNPNIKDWYIFSVATFCYRFTPIKCPGGQRGSKRPGKMPWIGD